LFSLSEQLVRQSSEVKRLIELLEPPIEALGYELVDLEAYSGRNGLLRLFIDREPGVTLADCELVSGQISAFLDVEDPLPGSYTLEVSSPGLDRRLRTAEHFRRFVGEEVKVQLLEPVDGRRRLRGELQALDGDVAILEVDGAEWRVKLDAIDVARLVPRI
jgi:ribosome maturation factor RimP